MRERTRVACPETKEQVIEKWIKTWDTLMFLHTELKDLVERMTIKIQHINDTDITQPLKKEDESRFNR